MRFYLLLLFCCFSFVYQTNAQLVINEVSQGPSGSKEFVEFVVVGDFNCNPNQNCVDLRGWYLDDNNGIHSVSPSGSGVANGCLQLTNHPMWACVPLGTLILIYNHTDLPANMPPTDTLLTDGNCRLVIPIDSTLNGICRFIVKNNFFPNQSDSNYPSSGFSECPKGPSWNLTGMANANDTYHTVNPQGIVVHAVSWGNNVLNTNIYFSGSAAGLVYSMENIVDNDPYNQANWTSKSASTSETPGFPNSVANANWIKYLNNNCSPRTPFLANFSSISPQCGQCNGQILVNGSGGFTPYQISLNGINQSSTTVNGLCSGTYTISISDSIGCDIDSVMVFGSAHGVNLASNISSANLCMGDSVLIKITGSSQLTWLPNQNIIRQNDSLFWAKPMSNTTYSFFTGNALCGDTVTINLIVDNLPPVDAGNSVFACSGSNIQLSATGALTYSWLPTNGLNNSNISNPFVTVYSNTIFTVIGIGVNGCKNIDTVGVYITNPPAVTVNGNQSICSGESVNLLAQGASQYSWLPVSGFLGSNQSAITVSPNQTTSYTVVGFAGNCSDTSFITILVNTKPLVQFNTTSICAQTPVTLSLINPSPGAIYSWWFNNNFITLGNSSSINTDSCGNFPIKVKGSLMGCSDSVTQIMEIKCKPVADFNNLPAQICKGSSVTLQNLSAISSGETLTYSWLLGNSFVSNLPNPTVSFSDTGSLLVSLIAIASIGCADTVNYSIYVINKPTISLTADTVCLGNSNKFLVTSSDVSSMATYSWNLGNGSSSTNSGSFNYTYSTAQNYVVTLIVINPGGCADTASTIASVVSPPNFNFITAGSICLGSSANFQIQNSAPGVNFVWDFNNDNIIDAQGETVSYTFLLSGDHLVKSIQQSVAGCVDTVEKIITVNEKPLAVNIPLQNNICYPGCLQLKGDSSVLNYWTVNGITQIGPITQWCLNPGKYSVKLLVKSLGGCQDSILLNNYLEVYSSPDASFTANPTEMELWQAQPQFFITHPEQASYIVNFGDSSVETFNNLQNFEHLYSDTGTYQVMVQAINPHGCIDTAFLRIKITPSYMVYIPNSFTPNTDDFNAIFKPVLNGVIPDGYLFRVFDRWGCLVFETKDLIQGWDGKYKGSVCPIDHYTYTLKLMDFRHKEYEFFGTVTLLR